MLSKTEIDDMSKVISDLITENTGTWGTSPVLLANGANKYIETQKGSMGEFVPLYITSEEARDDKRFLQYVTAVKKSLQNDYPVILMITGETEYIEKLTGKSGTVKLHNVNILDMRIDKIKGAVKVTCASWSEPIVIDLYECFTEDYYLGDFNLEPLTRMLLQVGHCIVLNEDVI